MEKAFLDHCRLDHHRLDVYDPQFDELLERMKKIPAKSMGGVDPCVAGAFRAGCVRCNCYIPLFDGMLERMKKSV